MKIRLNVQRGDRLAEIELDQQDGPWTLEEAAAEWFPRLDAAVGPPPEQGPGAPLAPAREPGDDDPARSGPTPARPGPVRGQEGPPRNGRQLWAWASNHGCLGRLKTLAKTQPGRIVDWPEDLVQWAHRELNVKAGSGKWGSG